MKLYLIRHAQSENNAKPESERVPDPGITELGIRQAKLLGERFSDMGIEVLVSSAFRRALLTAEAIVERVSKMPEVQVDWLHKEQATPSNLLEKASDYDVIHFCSG